VLRFFRNQARLCNKTAAPLRIAGHFEAKAMNENDFKHLRRLATERPKTRAGLMCVLWPEIRQALSAGHTIAEVLGALQKDGIEIDYSTFRNRIAKLKKIDIAETRQSDSDSAEAVMTWDDVKLLWRRLERETGIEPATSSLGSWHSTAELLPLISTTLFPMP
jgi:hypothetical protein